MAIQAFRQAIPFVLHKLLAINVHEITGTAALSETISTRLMLQTPLSTSWFLNGATVHFEYSGYSYPVSTGQKPPG